MGKKNKKEPTKLVNQRFSLPTSIAQKQLPYSLILKMQKKIIKNKKIKKFYRNLQ